MSGAPVTDVRAREAAAAERLLKDQFLAEALDEQVAIHTEAAILEADTAKREHARCMVLAVRELRGNLEAVFRHWQHAADDLRRARANE